MVETLVERGVGLVGCQKVVHPQVKQLLRRKVRTLEERERGLEGRRRERGRLESPSTVACCQNRRMTRPLPLSSSPFVF